MLCLTSDAGAKAEEAGEATEAKQLRRVGSIPRCHQLPSFCVRAWLHVAARGCIRLRMTACDCMQLRREYTRLRVTASDDCDCMRLRGDVVSAALDDELWMTGP